MGTVQVFQFWGCNAGGVSKNFGRRKARESAVLLGFRGFLGLNFQNSFLAFLGQNRVKRAFLTQTFAKV